VRLSDFGRSGKEFEEDDRPARQETGGACSAMSELIIALRALLPSVLRDGGRNPDNERRGWRGFGWAGDIFETRSYYLL
jgi:hypothetical protein